MVFLFEPFSEEKVFKKLLSRIECSLRKIPRDLFIVYVRPSLRRFVDASSFFAVINEHKDSVVFKSRKLEAIPFGSASS